jgi:hypothetical protein
MKIKFFMYVFLFIVNFNQAKASMEFDISEEDLAINIISNENNNQSCVNDYRKWRNQTATKAGLTPIVGYVGLAGNVVLGFSWEYGGFYAFKEAVGPTLTSITGVTISYVLPMTILVGTVTYETVMINRFVKASRAFRLVNNLENEDNKILDTLVRKVQKKRPELTKEIIKEMIIELNQSRALCDGSIVSTSRFLALKKSLSRRMANLKDIERYLIKNG